MNRRVVFLWAMTVVASLSTNARSFAETSKFERDALANFFKQGWDLSPEGRLRVDEQYDELALLAKGDARLKNALALIRMKQLKYHDALKLFTEIVASEKNNFPAWHGKIWLTMLTKSYSQAMVDLEKVSQLLPPTDDAEDKKNEAYKEMASFMGRIFGYLEGPVANITNEAERLAIRKKIVSRLSPERRRIFEEGRDAVTEKYLALTDQAIVSKERAKEDAEEDREEKLKGLDDEQQQLEKRRVELGSQRDKLAAELKSEIDDLNKQDRPLAQNFNTLDAQATVVRRELGILATEIGILQRRLNQERDPAIRDQILFDINRLSRIASRYDADLAVLTRQAAGIAAQRAQLQQRAAQAQNNIGGQIDRTDKENADIQKKLGRNVAVEKKLRKPASADTPETRAKAAQAASLITYEQFPLEREKQRLLDSF